MTSTQYTNRILMAEAEDFAPSLVLFIAANQDNNGCWKWDGPCRGGVDGNRYSGVQFRGKTWYVHRLVYAIFNGDLMDGKQIDHLCRNRRCVNPAHLEQVEGIENWRRGMSVTRQKQMQTHCKHGHELTPDNTYIHRRHNRRDARECRTCSLTARRSHKNMMSLGGQ